MTNSKSRSSATKKEECLLETKKLCLFQNIYKNVPKSGKVLFMRAVFSIILIAYFCWTVYFGPFAIIFTTLAIQVKCFLEVINIAYNICKIESLPWFRSISWYFLIAANYFFYCENMLEYFNVFINRMEYFRFAVVHHRFISFLVYLVGIIWFILTLKKKYDRRQFALLGWTHFALLIIVHQSFMVVRNVFQGLIWVIVCVTSVACNDTTAYLCGKLMGRTPLIQVSPKKTWEGFIGGAIFTTVYGFLISSLLCQYKYFVCPIEYKELHGKITMLTECEPDTLFHAKNYTLSANFFGILSADLTLNTYPFVLHTFWLSMFSSVIAPFGGFFASGFKRAFNVKDFGQTIPGHGGILDRFDCQIFMTAFVNVYISAFAKTSSVEQIYSKVMLMKPEDQATFFYMFEDSLIKNGFNITSSLVSNALKY